MRFVSVNRMPETVSNAGVVRSRIFQEVWVTSFAWWVWGKARGSVLLGSRVAGAGYSGAGQVKRVVLRGREKKRTAALVTL